jgi:hypothetical protein
MTAMHKAWFFLNKKDSLTRSPRGVAGRSLVIEEIQIEICPRVVHVFHLAQLVLVDTLRLVKVQKKKLLGFGGQFRFNLAEHAG